MAQVKELSFFSSRLIFRAIKTKNPVPRSLFAPKPTETLATQATRLSDFTDCGIKNSTYSIKLTT